MLPVGQMQLLIRAGLRKNFRDNFNSGEEEYSKFLKKSDMPDPEMSATIFTGPNRLLEIGDLEPVTFEQPKIGPKVMGVDKEFGRGVAIGKKIQEDDQYGKVKESGKWLADAVHQTYEYRGASFLDDAFAGSTFLGIDGLAWCSASHTFLNATGTWSNRLAEEVQLSMTGITAMMDLFGQLKNHNGDPITMMMDTLVIGNHEGDIQTALQIFSNSKEPYTADNNDNMVKKRLGSINTVISRYKVSRRSYFGIDSKWNDAEFRVRRAPTMEDDVDFKTGAFLHKVTTRFMIWGVDPRGWVGANAT